MNDWERLHRQAEEYKESYPPGTRVMLLHMNDPYHPIDDGMRGTVFLRIMTKTKLSDIFIATALKMVPISHII